MREKNILAKLRNHYDVLAQVAINRAEKSCYLQIKQLKEDHARILKELQNEANKYQTNIYSLEYRML